MDRAGVILKKCDRQLHKPQSNRACAAGTCQHTCERPARCPHAWTLRYWANGKQREQSFRDDIDAQGRVKYGSGQRKAKDARLKITHDKRADGAAFIDPRGGREDFCIAVDNWIARHPVGDSTKKGYGHVASKWVKSEFEGRSTAQVASDRDRVTELLNKKMGHLNITHRKRARTIITGTVEEAVKAGKIGRHYLHGIDLYDNGRMSERSDFVFPSHARVSMVAEAAGICVWLMRGCGLRIEEALAVHREDFTSGKALRLSGQASRDGREKLPLKHRKKGESRLIPVPDWLWEKVRDFPEGPLMPGNGERAYQLYGTVLAHFQGAAREAGIPKGFRPHSLRHAFASTLLSRGVPITDVARWMGHKDIRETYNTYMHFMPDAEDRALGVLNAEYAEWSTEATEGEETGE
jgi:integrase